MEKQRIALITGANRGIGFEIARGLGREGFRVILTAHSEAKGQRAAQLLQEEELDVVFYPLNVNDDLSISDLSDQLKATHTCLDVLVNNAAILSSSADTTRVGREEMQATLETNFFGPLLLSQRLLPLLRKSRDARIINLSSGMGAFNEMAPGYAAYRLSKTILNGLTAAMAADLAGRRIKVNAVCPGWVSTAMGGKGAPLTPAQGADTVIWLAMTPGIPNGKLFRDRKVIAW